MRRWGPIFALLVSVGLNVGIFAMLALEKLRPAEVSVAQPGPPPSRPETSPRGSEPPEQVDPPTDPPSNTRPQEPPPRRPDPEPRSGEDSRRPVGASPSNPPTARVEPPPSGEMPPLVVPRGGPPRQRLEILADRLGVVGAARARFLEIQVRMFEETSARRFEVQRLRRAVQIEMLAELPDRSRVEQLLAQVAERQAELDRKTFAAILEARDLLPATSRRMYVEFIGRIRFGAGEAAVPQKLRPRLNPRGPLGPNGPARPRELGSPKEFPPPSPNGNPQPQGLDRPPFRDPRLNNPAMRQEMLRRRRERLERKREYLESAPPPTEPEAAPEASPPPPAKR